MARMYAWSPSSRRAWVEIKSRGCWPPKWGVALLTEGVGRNTRSRSSPTGADVALLTEGVGRNWKRFFSSAARSSSPSSRRAWVEILPMAR